MPETDKHKNTKGQNKPRAVEVILLRIGRVMKNFERIKASHRDEGVRIKRM